MEPARTVPADVLDDVRPGWWGGVVALVAGLVLGAVLGAVAGALSPGPHTATVQLALQPDAAIDTQSAAGGLSLDTPTFVQGELVVLNGASVSDSVRRRLGLASDPTVVSTEIGQTAVVQVEGSAPTDAQALRIASSVAQVYTQTRVQRLTSQLDRELAAAQQQLADVRTQLNRVASRPGTASAQAALQSQYQTLLGTVSGYQQSLAQVASVVTEVGAPHASTASTSGTTKGALVGALLGAVLALLGFVGYRRLDPRVRSAGDLAGTGLPVVLPGLPRRRRRVARSTTPWRSGPARLLAAQLAGDDPGPLVVFGATRRVGASVVAASLAAALTDRGPVLLIDADPANAAEGSEPVVAETAVAAGVRTLRVPAPTSRVARREFWRRTLAGARAAGWVAVIDAPALSESDEALDALSGDAAAVLVVGLGVSRVPDVLSAADVVATRGRLTGAVINHPPPFTRWRRNRPTPAGVGTGEAVPGAEVERLTRALTGSADAPPGVSSPAAKVTAKKAPGTKTGPTKAATRSTAAKSTARRSTVRSPAERPAAADGPADSPAPASTGASTEASSAASAAEPASAASAAESAMVAPLVGTPARDDAVDAPPVTDSSPALPMAYSRYAHADGNGNGALRPSLVLRIAQRARDRRR